MIQSDRGRGRRLTAAAVAGAALVAGVALLGRGEQRLVVQREIDTTLSPATLWAELTMAFRDSTQSALWPNDLEWIRSDGLAEGATVRAVYRTPLGESGQSYTIGEFVEGRGFTYATRPGHPLRGGGRVAVTPAPGGARLIWSVDYTYRSLSPAALFVRHYFVPRFFRALEANLRRLEMP